MRLRVLPRVRPTPAQSKRAADKEANALGSGTVVVVITRLLVGVPVPVKPNTNSFVAPPRLVKAPPKANALPLAVVIALIAAEFSEIVTSVPLSATETVRVPYEIPEPRSLKMDVLPKFVASSKGIEVSTSNS